MHFKSTSRFIFSIPSLAFGAWMTLAMSACVSPALDEVAGVECLGGNECGARACVDGRCVACGDEVCDGFDNDCDDRVDEAFALATARDNCGACGQACEGQCVDGTCADGGMCEAEETACDGLDEDCDDSVDEGLLNACGTCGAIPDETCDGTDNDCDGMTDEGLLNACGACGEVPVEVCDGTDNDCDGATDEGTLNDCDQCGQLPAETCNEVDDDCDGTVDEMVLNACGGCGEVPVETCDGTDEDCDGTADEGFPGVGEACEAGVGVCRVDALTVCTEDGMGTTCPAVAGPPDAELCGDELDNDCDGAVDEGFEDAPEGPLGTACTVGEGLCQTSGVRICDPEDLSQSRCSVDPLPSAAELCNQLDDDCDGAMDEDFDFATDPLNCEFCGNICDLPHATSACEASACVIAVCEDNFQDVDDQPINGCECNLQAVDLPDPTFEDTNCDGIDGDLAGSVFLSRTHGVVNAAGSADAPVADLQEAIQIAERTGATAILIDRGTYPIATTLVFGSTVGLHGGYVYTPGAQPPWIRQSRANAPTRIRITNGVTLGLLAGADADVVIDNLSVELQASGPSLVGIGANACQRLELRDAELRVGETQPGNDGEGDGVALSSASQGQPAQPGGTGSAGGSNLACPNGTAGGGGGDGAALAGNMPQAGRPGDGDGGPGGDVSASPNPPGNGVDAPTALSGEPGTLGAVGGEFDIGTFTWRPLMGLRATAGRPGGGGGGGAGGYSDGILPGAGGAGGGAGGCAGVAALSGTSGASNFGIVATGGCELVFVRSVINLGRAGDGGDGGDGGVGGDARSGGAALQSAHFGGGAGGRGANGGCGGDGAAGHGGHSIGVLSVAGQPLPDLSSVEFISAGAGAAGTAGDAVCRRAADTSPDLASDGQSVLSACCNNPENCDVLQCPAPPG